MRCQVSVTVSAIALIFSSALQAAESTTVAIDAASRPEAVKAMKEMLKSYHATNPELVRMIKKSRSTVYKLGTAHGPESGDVIEGADDSNNSRLTFLCEEQTGGGDSPDRCVISLTTPDRK